MSERDWRRWGLVVFGLGLLLQLWLWSRGGVRLEPAAGGRTEGPCLVTKYQAAAAYGDAEDFLRDQVELLYPAIGLARGGELRPVSKQMTGGGMIPGSLLQILIGLPLRLWFDYRAASAVLVLAHLVAGLLLWRVVRNAAGERAAVLFLAVFWLSPWRLYHSGFLWEPAYMFLPAALHCWSVLAQRRHARFLPSLALGAALLVAPQLHASAVILYVLTGLLLVRRQLRLHWPGLALGAALGGLTLVPTLLAWWQGRLPPVAPGEGFFLFGLLRGYPMLRTAVYWPRLGSLDIGRRLRQTLFDPDRFGGETPAKLLDGAAEVLGVLALLSLPICLYASWRYLRRPEEGVTEGVRDLRAYAGNALLAALVATAISPATLQGWHLLVVLPVACLPVTAWVGEALAGGRRVLQITALLLVLLRVPIDLLLGLGHPMYHPAVAGPCAATPWREVPPEGGDAERDP